MVIFSFVLTNDIQIHKEEPTYFKLYLDNILEVENEICRTWDPEINTIRGCSDRVG